MNKITLLIAICSFAIVFGEEVVEVSQLDTKVANQEAGKYDFLLRPKRGLFDFGLGGYGLYGGYGDYDRYGGYDNYDRYGGYGGYDRYGGYGGYGGYDRYGGYNGYRGYNDYYNSYPHRYHHGGYNNNNNYANSNADSFSASAGFGPFQAGISTSHASANAGSSQYGGRPYFR